MDDWFVKLRSTAASGRSQAVDRSKALTSVGRVRDPFRRRLWGMQMNKMTLEQARELAELTSHIVANLQAIDADENDIEALLEQTNRIASNLNDISEDQSNLDELFEQTDRITGNLNGIELDEANLDELLEKTAEVCANLENIKEGQAAHL
jgi:predicted ribosome quality control (RQC) complex YloA/Tae2 family protein